MIKKEEETKKEYPPLGEERGALLQERTKSLEKRGFKTLTGEIIISVEMAKKLAQKHDCAVEGEIALYLVHGLLHLLGYNDKQKERSKKNASKRRRTVVGVLGFVSLYLINQCFLT